MNKIGILLVFVFIALSIPLQRSIDGMKPASESIEETLYFSSSTLKFLSLGYEELLADIYWIRAIQYYGERADVGKRLDLFYPYLDIITDLDPKFVNAYRYGGTFLAEPPPLGIGDVEKGINLFDKGRQNNPHNWHIPFEEAFVYYWYVNDYRKAAELFREAGEKPGISEFRSHVLKGMAALTYARGGSREVSKQMWQIMYETTTSEGRKKFALRSLKEIDAMDMSDHLTEALRKYIAQYKTHPSDLEELKRAGVISEIPKEPLGGEFIIVKKLGVVKSTSIVDYRLRQNIISLNMLIGSFRGAFGRSPKTLEELKEAINKGDIQGSFPEHPLGEEYIYNPQKGKVEYK